MIGDIYSFQAAKDSGVHYCRVVDETPGTARVVIVRGTPLASDLLPPQATYWGPSYFAPTAPVNGNGLPASDARPLTKPFYLFKRNGLLVRGRWRFELVKTAK